MNYGDYRDYQNARDASWRILLNCKVKRLPVNINAVCRKLGIRVLSYRDGSSMIERVNLEQVMRSTDGMTFYARETPIILFDEKKPVTRAKFTVAHEVGHIVLGHMKSGSFTTMNREPRESNYLFATSSSRQSSA